MKYVGTPNEVRESLDPNKTYIMTVETNPSGDGEEQDLLCKLNKYKHISTLPEAFIADCMSRKLIIGGVDYGFAKHWTTQYEGEVTLREATAEEIARYIADFSNRDTKEIGRISKKLEHKGITMNINLSIVLDENPRLL